MVGAADRFGPGDLAAVGRTGPWGAVAVGVGFVLWGLLVTLPAARFADLAWGWLAVAALGVAPALVLPRLLGTPNRDWDQATAREDGGRLEREALAAVSAAGAATPAEVALRTSLTADQAAALLEALASLGAVQAVDGPGGPTYGVGDDVAPTGNAVALEGPTANASVVATTTATGIVANGSATTALNGQATAAPAIVDPLSGRELDVLALLATGRPNREIAGVLYVSVGTVKSHTNNIFRKLGARNRTEAIARARDLSLV
jgi:DNA-binding CsgD family transcriptional regulator